MNKTFRACLMALPLAALSATVSAFPTQTIKIVVPAAAGGASDAVIRPVAALLSELLGKPVIVENKPGATGSIGMQAVASAKPDGHTLVFGTISTLVTNVAVNPAVPYDPVKDFAPISIFVRSPFLLSVPAASPVKTLEGFVKAAKAEPGKLTYASFGNGSFGHLFTENFAAHAGIKLLHVPYKGSAPAMTAVIGGEVDAFFDGLQSSLSFATSGKLRVLAVGSPERSPSLPQVPTLAELGYPEVDGSAWWGLFAPAGTSPAVVATLHAALEKALTDEKLRQVLQATGASIQATSPADSQHMVSEGLAQYRALVRRVQIKLE